MAWQMRSASSQEHSRENIETWTYPAKLAQAVQDFAQVFVDLRMLQHALKREYKVAWYCHERICGVNVGRTVKVFFSQQGASSADRRARHNAAEVNIVERGPGHQCFSRKLEPACCFAIADHLDQDGARLLLARSRQQQQR